MVSLKSVRATNSFCIPLLSYGFGIVDWTKAEIAQFDIIVRKTLTAAKSHHPRSAIERLYVTGFWKNDPNRTLEVPR